MTHVNTTYFGEWEIEEKHPGQATIPRDVTDDVNSHLTEHVQAVNEKLNWELDKAEVTILVSKTAAYTDFM